MVTHQFPVHRHELDLGQKNWRLLEVDFTVLGGCITLPEGRVPIRASVLSSTSTPIPRSSNNGLQQSAAQLRQIP